MRKGNKTIPIRALLDPGSQKSYFHSNVFHKLGVNVEELPSSVRSIKTYLGEGERQLHKTYVEINICCDQYSSLPVFVCPSLDIGFSVKGIAGAAYNITSQGFKLADTFYGLYKDTVSNLEGLLGIDAFMLLRHFKISTCMNGTVFDTCRGIIPYGSAEQFLTPSQREGIFKIKDSAAPSKSKKGS